MLKQKIAIPSYFPSDASGNGDWDAAASAGALLGLVVVNPASGPGYTSPYWPGGAKHTEIGARIEQMRAAGADVVGYVTTNYRDSRVSTVQREHRFTVDVATGVVTTRNSSGHVSETGWRTGFGPIQVGSDATLPGGLTAGTDYFWIAQSPQAGKFATSKANATGGFGIGFTSAGDPGAQNNNHGMGLSRNLANIANVLFEIDQFYARWPSIDGMFFDEMNNIGNADDLNYYEQIFDHVNTKAGKSLVIQNPGQSFPESMVNVADRFLAYESSSSGYADYKPSWRSNYPAAKFWHAIHSCPLADMPKMIDLSRTRNAGSVYVTDRVFPGQNVWAHIASNFAAEIAKISHENSPPAVTKKVPFVQELRPASAAAKLKAVGLKPEFKGGQGPNSWVWRQSPQAGKMVPAGSKVALQLRSGPRL